MPGLLTEIQGTRMLSRVITASALTIFLCATTFAAGGGGSAGSKQSSEYREAVKAIKKEDYAAAIELLQKSLEGKPKDANAWNYMGYSLRKQQRYDEALAAYEKALKIKPKHKGSLQYLGELYLQTDQLDKAKAQLQRLDDVCFLSCKEYRKLKKRIQEYEAG